MVKVARSRILAPALLCALVGACVEPAGAERIIGPDGTRMLHVHCADEQAACFQLAGELCPRGYFLSPIFDPHDGNFLVRCKDGSEASVIANAAPQRPVQSALPPAPPIAVRARAADDTWPPYEVAKPSEPWPAPSAGAPVTQTVIGDVDLGY